ncbi:MAG: hypothetical protein GVY14_05290, partial [Spirochaetes bacterium]|nr:hypothetical protein [Spirochaetota bacterium]
MFSRHTFALLATVLVPALIGMLTACSPPAGTGGGGDGDAGSPAPRSFSGVVYDAVSGEPIPGAEVSLGWDSETTDPGDG